MEPSPIKLNYLDLREFLYKFFDLEFNPLSIFSVIIQLALIAWLLYQVYIKFRGTQADRVLRGLIMITPLILACYIFKLSILTKLIEIFSPTILIGLIVIFAPEFRRVLMQIGGDFTMLNLIQIPESKQSIIHNTNEITGALKLLQESRTGALIVIEKAKVDRYYINPGYQINAKLSKELILTLFSPKSPLHDGAVTVRGSTIMAAGVILPMTENPKLDWQYGTRHRAAIGFSEVNDALCIVVSEETGDISIANQGRLVKYHSLEMVQKQIENFYSYLTRSEKPLKGSNKNIYDFFSLLKAQKK
jgi:diadenylate cyclase